MIEASHLTKRFGGVLAVDDLSFRVTAGEVVGFLGPNGAGKSTSLRMLTGFVRPTAGRAQICGIDVGRKPVAAKRRFGYLPEGAPVYGDMTPYGFLAFVGGVHGLSGRALDAALGEAADRTGLGAVMDQPVETLSKGFKRRVCLAAALIHDPAVLILDEPTDGLDPNQKDEVRALIRHLAPDKAILLSTHALEEVEAVCTRAIIIARGRILADASPRDLAARDPSGRLDAVFRRLTLGDTLGDGAVADGAGGGAEAA